MTRQRPLSAAIILLVSALAIPSGARAQAAPPVIVHGPLLTNPAPNGMTIVWFTDKPCTSWVEYATGGNFRTFPSFGGLIQIARPGSHGLIDADTVRHEVRLAGLEPGKAYRYRVVSKSILAFQPYEVVYGPVTMSEIREFRTLDLKKAAFGFVVFQDLHNDAAKLAALAAKADPTAADLIFFNGDNVADAGKEEDVFADLFDPAARRFAGAVPIVMTRGNHETRGAMARRLESYFPTPSGRYFYAFTHGPVRFIILDSGEDKPDDSPVYAGLADFDRYRAAQAAWLKEEIQSPDFKNASFRVVFSHIPPYGKGYASEQLTALWGPILNEGGVDLVISGHLHSLYRFEPAPGKNAFPVLGGPTDGVIKASASNSSVLLQVIDVNGVVKDELTVSAKPGRR
ncbi:MAG: metallophosphoesterase family protein [Candidatus Aminicenantes bacterium]|nr:metallophosphoesterase family protein [Candidatus Aminicenantes bacterium]